MPDTGRELGADLYGLTIVAKRNFPTVATDYRHAQQALAATSSQEGAFRRPDHFGGGPSGPAMGAWSELRDTVITIVSETATNLELTSQALLLATSWYAAADQGAANELSRLLAADGTPQPEQPR